MENGISIYPGPKKPQEPAVCHGSGNSTITAGDGQLVLISIGWTGDSGLQHTRGSAPGRATSGPLILSVMVERSEDDFSSGRRSKQLIPVHQLPSTRLFPHFPLKAVETTLKTVLVKAQ